MQEQATESYQPGDLVVFTHWNTGERLTGEWLRCKKVRTPRGGTGIIHVVRVGEREMAVSGRRVRPVSVAGG